MQFYNTGLIMRVWNPKLISKPKSVCCKCVLLRWLDNYKEDELPNPNTIPLFQHDISSFERNIPNGRQQITRFKYNPQITHTIVELEVSIRTSSLLTWVITGICLERVRIRMTPPPCHIIWIDKREKWYDNFRGIEFYHWYRGHR